MKTIYTLILTLCCFSAISQSINKYDGVYENHSYTFRSGDPSRTGFPLPYEVGLVTSGADSVQSDILHKWADGSGIGITYPIFIIDSTTNIVYVTASGFVVMDAPGYSNRYDPITKTIYAAFTWGAGTSSRLAVDTLIYLRPRSVLPLKLISFEAILSGVETHLTWTSVNEVDVKSYIIERSNEGRLYTALGRVDAVNRSEANYSFNDKPTSININYYYRLKIIDVNGSHRYSKIAVVKYHADSNLEIYPNPATTNIVLKHTKAILGATVSIEDGGGKQIKIITVQSNAVQTKISVDKLKKGSYIITYHNNGEMSVNKFVKQ